MKPLDVTVSVDYGYRLAWVERRYLLHLALVPMAIKFICLSIILAAGWEREYLRGTLVMLPSFFADGWMLAHLCRLVFLGQRWPFRPSGDAVQDGVMLSDRAYGISAGTLFFVVIQYLLSGMQVALITSMAGLKTQTGVVAQPPHDPSVLAAIAAMVLLVLSLWSVRFMFLYVPVAAGMRTRSIVHSSNNMLLSLQMLGVVLVSCIPLALLAEWVADAFVPDDTKPGDLGMVLRALLIIWQVFINTLTYIITTASIAYGLKIMMEKTKP